MAYACCDQCKYQCRVAATLLGRQVRCPKCTHVVSVTAELLFSTQNRGTSAKAGADSTAELYVGNIMRRRGPISLSQLELLARWEMIGQNELLSDESGDRQTTVHEFLASGGWPSAPEAPAPPKPPDPPRRPTRFGRILSVRKPEKPPAAKQPMHDPTLTHDEFMALIDRAVHMERNARTVEFERTESQVEVYVPGPGARFVRTGQFDWSYNLIAFVFIVNALICCLFSTSTMGMFAKRLL